jgi:hypothetical protein
VAIEPEVTIEPKAESEVESAPEILAAEEEPEQRRRFHLFRHEAGESSAMLEGLDDASTQRPVEEPGELAEAVETTIEIELPPEIEVERIERTLEDVVRREPAVRRRRWSREPGAEKEATPYARESEVTDGESELRLTAEQERRRREREYLRSLRVLR